MSNGDLANRTRAMIATLARSGNVFDLAEVTAILSEWLEDAPLIGNLARSRALVGRLLEDQKGMIGALQVGIYHAERLPDDGPLQTFKEIAIKRISAAVQVP